jgi:hypothetical protein
LSEVSSDWVAEVTTLLVVLVVVVVVIAGSPLGC